MTNKGDLNFSVLIPDGEHPRLFQVVYCLSKIKNMSIHVLSSTKQNPMRYSRHIKVFKVTGKILVEQWLYEIDSYVLKNDIDNVLPIQETSIENLIVYNNRLKANKLVVPLPSIKSFKDATDKANLALHLAKFNIAHPRTIIIEPNGSRPDIDQLGYPIIAKPSKSLDGHGIKILSNKNDYELFLKSVSSEYVLQEFIEGYEIDCSVLCKDGNILLHIIQRGILFESRKFSPAIGLKFLHEEELLKTVRTLMASLEWTGVAHIDLRYDSKLKIFKVIEINGRFWGSMDGAEAAGYNFPYLYCLLSKNIAFQVGQPKLIEYFNMKGLVKRIRQRPLLLLNWYFLKRNTCFQFILKDPLPVLAKFVKRTKVLLRN